MGRTVRRHTTVPVDRFCWRRLQRRRTHRLVTSAAPSWCAPGPATSVQTAAQPAAAAEGGPRLVYMARILLRRLGMVGPSPRAVGAARRRALVEQIGRVW